MSVKRVMRIALAISMQFGVVDVGRAQALAGLQIETPSPSRVIWGYRRDAAEYLTNGYVVLRYQDPEERVITVSIRRRKRTRFPLSSATDSGSVIKVEGEYLRAATATQTGICQIAFAERDSVPVVGGSILGRAMAHACLIGGSTVIRLLYTYPVRDRVVVFQSAINRANWHTSRFGWFVREFVQTMYADIDDRVTRPAR